MAPVVEVAGLRKEYLMGSDRVYALRGVDLTVEPGEFVAVMGPSGSGKSTFMHIVGFLDRRRSGTTPSNGRDVSAAGSDDALADIRSRELGFVFQAYNLLARTSAVENVELPMLYAGVRETRTARRIALREARRSSALLTVRAATIPTKSRADSSNASRSRARSSTIPELILADEPTGALDTKRSTTTSCSSSRRLNDEHGITIMLVTHEPDVAAYAKRIVTFRDGCILSDTTRRESENWPSS